MMNPSDWKLFKTTFTAILPKLNCTFVPNSNLPECLLPSTCADAAIGVDSITFTIGPGKQQLKLAISSLFRDSTDFDSKAKNTNCYLAMSENYDNPVTTTLVLGSIFFEQYYVVFDMTPPVSSTIAPNQIGFGPINPRNVLGD